MTYEVVSVCGARIRRAPMSWLRTRSAYRIIVDHSGKEYFHHIQQHTGSCIVVKVKLIMIWLWVVSSGF